MTRQTTSRSLKAILGVALSAVGLLLLFVNVDNATAKFSRPSVAPSESIGATVELGLAGLRAAQAYLFDPASFQSGLEQILVSFWPLILVIFGVVLLQKAFGQRVAHSRAGFSFQDEGARE